MTVRITPRVITSLPAAALVALSLTVSSSMLHAQTTPDPSAAPESESFGDSLMKEGAKLFLRGLMSEMEPTLDEMGKALDELRPALEQMGPQLRELIRLMGDVKNYAMPELLPNGDILIRRTAPLDPPEPGLPDRSPPPPLPPGLRLPGPNGEIDL